MDWMDILVACLQCAISVGGALLALFTYVRNGRMKVSQRAAAEEISEIRRAVVPKAAVPHRYYLPVFDETGKVVGKKEVASDEFKSSDEG